MHGIQKHASKAEAGGAGGHTMCRSIPGIIDATAVGTMRGYRVPCIAAGV